MDIYKVSIFGVAIGSEKGSIGDEEELGVRPSRDADISDVNICSRMAAEKAPPSLPPRVG